MSLVEERPLTSEEVRTLNGGVRLTVILFTVAIVFLHLAIFGRIFLEMPRTVRIATLLPFIILMPIAFMSLPLALARLRARKSGVVLRFKGVGRVRIGFVEKDVHEVEIAGNGFLLRADGHAVRQLVPVPNRPIKLAKGPKTPGSRLLSELEQEELSAYRSRVESELGELIPSLIFYGIVTAVSLIFDFMGGVGIGAGLLTRSLFNARYRRRQRALLPALVVDTDRNRVEVTADGREYLPSTGIIWRSKGGHAAWRTQGRRIEELHDADFAHRNLVPAQSH